MYTQVGFLFEDDQCHLAFCMLRGPEYILFPHTYTVSSDGNERETEKTRNSPSSEGMELSMGSIRRLSERT